MVTAPGLNNGSGHDDCNGCDDSKVADNWNLGIMYTYFAWVHNIHKASKRMSWVLLVLTCAKCV